MATKPVSVVTVQQSAATSSASARFYRPELDSLRFFAFFAVFLHHNLPKESEFYVQHGLPPVLASFAIAGAYGVDLFFCLSAYLITELLVRERLRAGHLDVRAFYVRRILRIWPLYFLMVAIAAALPYFIQGEQFGPKYVAMFLLLAGNWSFVILGAAQSVALPLWSISVEEQFYLLWPLAVRKCSERAMAWIALSLIVAAVMSRHVVVREALHPDSVLWFGTLTRLDPIASGILLSLALRRRIPTLRLMGRMLLGLIGAALWLVSASWPVPEITYLLVSCGAVCMLVSVLGLDRSPVFNSRPFVTLGTISYGLYVYHYTVLRLIRLYVFPGPLGGFQGFAREVILSFVTTVAIAWVSYQVFEKPFLRLKQRFASVESRPV